MTTQKIPTPRTATGWLPDSAPADPAGIGPGAARRCLDVTASAVALAILGLPLLALMLLVRLTSPGPALFRTPTGTCTRWYRPGPRSRRGTWSSRRCGPPSGCSPTPYGTCWAGPFRRTRKPGGRGPPGWTTSSGDGGRVGGHRAGRERLAPGVDTLPGRQVEREVVPQAAQLVAFDDGADGQVLASVRAVPADLVR